MSWPFPARRNYQAARQRTTTRYTMTAHRVHRIAYKSSPTAAIVQFPHSFPGDYFVRRRMEGAAKAVLTSVGGSAARPGLRPGFRIYFGLRNTVRIGVRRQEPPIHG